MTEKKIVKKTKTKTKKLKKVTNFFQNDSKILEFTKTIDSLNLERQNLEKDIQLIMSSFKEKNKEEDLSRLPLQSVKDLQDFEAGQKISFTMDLFDDRLKLRQDHQKKLQDLTQIDKNIASQQIELLLAKIDCVMTKIE